MTQEFRLDAVVEDGRQWIVVHGELDLATAPELDALVDQRFAEAPGQPLVLDLVRCGFVDSSGARSVVRAGDRARAEGRPVDIICPSESGARFTLDLLGVGEAVPVHESADLLDVDDTASSA